MQCARRWTCALVAVLMALGAWGQTCTTDADCPARQCFSALCVFGSCGYVPFDGISCTIDGVTGTCSAGVCVPLVAGCTTDPDCDSDHYCADATWTCTPVPSCDDSSICTTDDFDKTTETCTNVYIPGCCDATHPCPDSSTDCLVPVCLENTCSNLFEPAGTECMFAFPGEEPVPGVCDEAGVCTPVTAECTTDADCDDGLIVSRDTCVAGACEHVLDPTIPLPCNSTFIDLIDNWRSTVSICTGSGGSYGERCIPGDGTLPTTCVRPSDYLCADGCAPTGLPACMTIDQYWFECGPDGVHCVQKWIPVATTLDVLPRSVKICFVFYTILRERSALPCEAVDDECAVGYDNGFWYESTLTCIWRDEVCEDGDLTTIDTCVNETHTCLHTPVLQCTTDEDCDSDHYCADATWTCTPVPSCDEDEADCFVRFFNKATEQCDTVVKTAGEPCVFYGTNLTGQCLIEAGRCIVNCTTDADCGEYEFTYCWNVDTPWWICSYIPPCDDSSICTTDYFDKTTETCIYIYIPGCCDARHPCPDDGNECTAVECVDDHTCYSRPLPDGTACTYNGVPGTCSAGVCTPLVAGCTTDADCAMDHYCADATWTCMPIPFCDDSSICTTDDFDKLTETCMNVYIPGCCDVTHPCPDDGNECTAVTCIDNVCVTTNIDYEPCTMDGGAPGICYGGSCVQCVEDAQCVDVTSKPYCWNNMCSECSSGFHCNDSNLCTTDTCVNGECTYVPIACPPDGNDCTKDYCDPATGLCYSHEPDGFACTMAGGMPGQCAAGVCVSVYECEYDADCERVPPNPCEDAVCNTMTHTCEYYPLPDHMECDADGLFCTFDQCAGGVCVFAHARLCEDESNCTADSCDEALDMCVNANVADGTPCDYSGTTPTGTCYAGTCMPYAEPCTKDMDCLDTDDCTIDRCVAGLCVHTLVDCDDANECTIDGCHGMFRKKCYHTAVPNGVPCLDDGDATTLDVCQYGRCIHLAPHQQNCTRDRDCDDGIKCTRDRCDRKTHLCTYRFVDHCCENDMQCDHGHHCAKEICDLARNRCVWREKPGCCVSDRGCSDGLDSTLNHCNVATHTCEFTPIAGWCATEADCADGDLCTRDVFDAALHTCTHESYDWPCECHAQADCAHLDSTATCTVGACVAGQCLPMETCDDSDPETVDTCAADGTCVHTSARSVRDDLERDLAARPECRAIGRFSSAWESLLGEHLLDPAFDLRRYICPDVLEAGGFETLGDGPVVTTSMGAPEFRAFMDAMGELPTVEMLCGAEEAKVVAARHHHHPLGLGPCADFDLCTVDTCNPDPEGPACLHFEKNCDDNDACTDDFCWWGICVHSTHNHHCPSHVGETCVDYECFSGDGLCYAHDSGCDVGGPFGHDACTYRLCQDGEWVDRLINCNDTDGCTHDECVSPIGACRHTRVDCSDGNPYTPDWCESVGPLQDGDITYYTHVCHHEQVQCEEPPPANLTQCQTLLGDCSVRNLKKIHYTDGDKCTIDTCDPLLGPVHTPKECPTQDPCNEGICDPSDGKCVVLRKTCDDGDPCTVDRCVVGECVHEEKDCSDSDFCTIDLCNSVTGECAHIPDSCNDGMACTLDICVPGEGCINPSIPCIGAVPGECIYRWCNNITGIILELPLNCNDDSTCTRDFCRAGVCYNLPPRYNDSECVVPVDEASETSFVLLDAPEERHHYHPKPYYSPYIPECRVGECMVFVCDDDQIVGAYHWELAVNGTACNFTDPCDRYWCDGDGYCVLKPGAPDVCPSQETPSSAAPNVAIILAIVLPPAGLLLVVALLLIILTAGGRRRQRRRGERLVVVEEED